MNGPRAYHPEESSRAFSSLSLAAFIIGIVGIVLGALGAGAAYLLRGDVADLEKRLRSAEQSIATLEREQEELNTTIENATTASEIAEAILRRRENQ